MLSRIILGRNTAAAKNTFAVKALIVKVSGVGISNLIDPVLHSDERQYNLFGDIPFHF
jgi:hypothetical protein